MVAKRRALKGLYTRPLPLAVVALPPLIPHNPLSVAQYMYQLIVVPLLAKFKRRNRRVTAFLEMTSDNSSTYVSAISVPSEEDMMGLWKDGFFGKGTQSRSDPTWEKRTTLRLAEKDDIVNDIRKEKAPEELTAKRRAVRKKFKLARANAQQQQQQLQESKNGEGATGQNSELVATSSQPEDSTEVTPPERIVVRAEDSYLRDGKGKVRRLENLQLTFQEAFFLSYALDAIDIYDDYSGDHISTANLLGLIMPDWRPDNSFILNYVVYHHYRSHGWCIRNGVKFGVDYLLYRRGPPISHAEFAVVIIPVCQDELKNQLQTREWSWLSGVNRIVGGVKKTLVLCYVEVPDSIDHWSTVEELLKRYKVREVTVRRWMPSRSRD
ncbi:SEN2 subunit of the tRNA splicing endonuclease-like protein [Limtongia smithiae]|uniref:SEN2 subunit of the tRNA splicing endonuclease-like protein n=1 Tax=Limtongia smithiae TaxID=1125753 RepID=UPI0034CE7CBD